ncbi:MAG: hypothetical protein GAK43_02159 [Stenotrophomonas maltophilia]|nr:MAG: hypothetical protein GAK43_02159 [Stenotrophomonas maltophilia]
MFPLFSRPSLIGALLILASPFALAAPECQAPQQPRVEALFSSHDYTGAIAKLEAVRQQQDQCSTTTLDSDWYWLRSDLALAYLKAGREEDCLGVLQPLVDNPRSERDVQRNLDGDTRVARALETNQRLCVAAHEARLRTFRSVPCTGVIPGASASVSLADGRCLGLIPASEPGSCPRVVEWRNGQMPHPLTLLDPEQHSVLADTSRCCSAQTLSVEPQGLRLRVQGEGRDCFGGTAYDRIDAIFRRDGEQLRPEQDYSSSD